MKIRLKNKNMNSKCKRIYCFLILFLISFSCVSTIIYAGSKRYESVYVSLDDYGNVKEATMYVDTTLDNDKSIVDYGKFKSVENMSNKVEADYNLDGSLVWNLKDSSSESFAYNVVLDESTYKNIPWDISLSYMLNGKDTEPNKLAHSNGLVKITVSVIPNDNADDFYKNNFMMEVTSDFDMNDYISVHSDDAVEIVTGNTKTLMWVVLPGASSTFEIELGTDDFQYDGLTFAIVPVSGEISEKIVDLIKDKQDVEEAYKASMDVTDIFLSALGNMSLGLNQTTDGLFNFKSGVEKFHNLKDSRDNTVNELESEVDVVISDIDKVVNHVQSLKDKFDDFYAFVEDINNETNNLEKALNNLENNLSLLEKMAESVGKDINDVNRLLKKLDYIIEDSRDLIDVMIDSSDVDSKTISNKAKSLKSDLESAGDIVKVLYASDSSNSYYQNLAYYLKNAGDNLSSLGENLSKLSSISNDEIFSLDSLYNDLEDLSKCTKVLEGDLDVLEKDSPNFKSTINSTKKVISNLESVIDSMNLYMKKIGGYENDTNKALSDLESMLLNFKNISVTISNSMPSIKSSFETLSSDVYNGAENSIDGISSITNEVKTISNQAVIFRDAKNKIDKVIRNNWSDIDDNTTIFEMDPNVKKLSFSSSYNEEPQSVQIFLKTPEIKEDSCLDLADFEKENESVGVWGRILELFKKIFNAIINIFR